MSDGEIIRTERLRKEVPSELFRSRCTRSSPFRQRAVNSWSAGAGSKPIDRGASGIRSSAVNQAPKPPDRRLAS
jgi:hypothetical protein